MQVDRRQRGITQPPVLHATTKGSTMLERMDEFFDSRLAIYDEHQLDAIASARDFLS